MPTPPRTPPVGRNNTWSDSKASPQVCFALGARLQIFLKAKPRESTGPLCLLVGFANEGMLSEGDE